MASNKYPPEAKGPHPPTPRQSESKFPEKKMCLTLSISEMPNRLKDKESGVLVDFWLTDKLPRERRQRVNGGLARMGPKKALLFWHEAPVLERKATVCRSLKLCCVL